jgi:hypothetical protein
MQIHLYKYMNDVILLSNCIILFAANAQTFTLYRVIYSSEPYKRILKKQAEFVI